MNTTNQMLEAPYGAVFIWCNDRLDYPLDLARHLGRRDLQIRPRSWLTPNNVMGRRQMVIIDHAARVPGWWHAVRDGANINPPPHYPKPPAPPAAPRPLYPFKVELGEAMRKLQPRGVLAEPVRLTDEQIDEIEDAHWSGPGLGATFNREAFARAIEAAVLKANGLGDQQ